MKPCNGYLLKVVYVSLVPWSLGLKYVSEKKVMEDGPILFSFPSLPQFILSLTHEVWSANIAVLSSKKLLRTQGEFCMFLPS